MEINISESSVTSLVDKLTKKIFSEDNSIQNDSPFKIHFNRKVCKRLREIVFKSLLSRQSEETGQDFNVRERLSIVSFKLKAYGLESKANHLERLVSSLDFTEKQSTVYTGCFDAIYEIEAIIKILLDLSTEAEMLTRNPCEVWRKVDSCYQRSAQSISLDSGTGENEVNIDYRYFPKHIFEALPTFGVPKQGFESNDSIQVDIFNQEPGSCGLTKWFGAKTKDSFNERTRSTLYSALIHSKTSDMKVTLELPELSTQQDFRLKPLLKSQVTEDEGFEDASDELSTSSALSDDSGICGLEIWDEALKLKSPRFYTWEGRKQITPKGCKHFVTEAGPEVINYLCDMRIAEASFLINSHPEQLRYLKMTEFIRDCLLVIIGVPSQTFHLEKSTASFHVSTEVRLSGCSPDSLQKTLTQIAEIGTNYFRLNKFTTCQRHSNLIRSSVLRAFISGLRTFIQKYRQSVVTVKASSVQSILELSTKFRKQAYELKFLSDICMCSEGFAAEYGKPKPKFPVGAKLLTYLYELCLRNMNSPVSSLILYLLKVACTPYLRFIQQWVFKGKCVDFYKEFMIFENDVYLAHRDKHYWTNGYVMSGTDKMEGVPVFLKELSKDMFICGKSINLLKLCCPEHHICNPTVEIPVMKVTYSLSSLHHISDCSREYAEKMRKLQQNIKFEWLRKKNEEINKQEELVARERQKANKELAEIQELVEKAKKALAEKRKEELNFLKQQMEDAINRKEFERKEAAEEDKRIARTSLKYEVTTAKIDDEIAEQARQELIQYYEELSREAELREKHAMWLVNRHALKNKRDTFLEHENDKLNEMKEGISKKRDKDNGQASEVVRNERTANMSTAQDLIYNQDNLVESQPKNTRIGQAMRSTAQEIIYPDVATTDVADDIKKVAVKASDSTIQDLMYPPPRVTTQNVVLDNADITIRQPSTNTGVDGSKTIPPAMDSSVQNLIYHSEEHGRTATHSGSLSVRVKGIKTVTRAMSSTVQNLIYSPSEQEAMVPSTSSVDLAKPQATDSTAQNLMYNSSNETAVQHTSSRGFGNAFQSTIQQFMYGDGDAVDGTRTIATSRGYDQPSVMKDILYPDAVSLDTNQVVPRSTRGSAPPSTIQNLMYRSSSVIEEPEQPKKPPLTHEDVWLATQFESLPDNFDILDNEPFGDIFARVISDQPEILNGEEFDSDDDVDENDACNVLCLPVILKRCVKEPLTTQIEMVNSAVVRYFMDNLKLVEHFETLKKFLLMEDGEFSYSLTQQLFEKISTGVTPEQLCCISSLNSIMAQSIQSSVYACRSENSSSLSFVLKSIPDIFKRNDVKVLDFIGLRYKIQWPVNIIITENCITKYNRIFAFILRLKRIAWILQDIRYSLKRIDKCASNSPQLRKIHLFRHEMSHFVNDVQGYISNQILHVSWQEFLNSLEHNVRNLDDLHDCHADYLNKSLFRALLNKKAAPVMNIITDQIFTKVLKFHTQLVSSSWSVDQSSGLVVHPAFSLLCSTYESFKESTCFLLTVINKLVNRGYQPHLEELLLRLNFNSYYDKSISTPNSPTFVV
ncbi:gamma-tubulin complex component 6-like [Dendronephthya gigantea]|uniref:gamma-tubulin complex component 6-like n=1 Tax=Dendronephthya gigantea TaxID=151771 RepID=UPI00106CCF6A|nr:gamma-tubulin complex component 6-like [Dendronephthya gigantea]